MLGATDPLKSNPGTIRGDFAIDVGRLLSLSLLLTVFESSLGLFMTLFSVWLFIR